MGELMINWLISVKRFLYDALWNVPLFAIAMIRKLWRNKHKYLIGKGHWKNDPAWQWLERVSDETKELKEAMTNEAFIIGKYGISNRTHVKHFKKRRLYEAADIANFAMMAGKAKQID